MQRALGWFDDLWDEAEPFDLASDFEGYYASVFCSHFASAGPDVAVEDATGAGRLDMAVRHAESVHLFESTPPLPHLTKESRFRLFLFDIGILRHLLRLPYALQRAPNYAYRGFMAENFVQTEMCARVGYPTYGWAEGRAEIEFLHQARNGEIVPVEVKSRRRRARSLSSYIARYAPERAVTLTVEPRGGRDGVVTNWPLYEAQFLREL